jgi:hypothetical protein
MMQSAFAFILLCALHFCSNAIVTRDKNQCSTCSEVLAFCLPCCGIDRTFMYTRPIYRNLGMEQSIWHNMIFDCAYSPDLPVAFQVIGMGQGSLRYNKASRYFLFNDLELLTVKGDAVINNNPFMRDVRAEWLGLPSDFSGSITVSPKQWQAAVMIEGKYSLRCLTDNPLFNTLWIGFSMPYQIVQNELKVHDANPPDTPANGTLAYAFNNPMLQYARLGVKDRKHTVAEIEFKLGSNMLDRDGFQIGMYSLALLATGRAQNPTYTFAPYIGNNGRFGFGTGVTFQLPLNDCVDEYEVSFVANIENIFFFSKTERRTVDLEFKPWSRYLLLVNRDGRINIPAANVLTVPVKVHPFNMVDLEVALRWEGRACSGLEFEMAYNLFARGREKVTLRHCFPDDYGIAGVGFLPGTTIPATASQSDIQQQAANDTDIFGNLVFVPITQNDLELNSAAARGSINHRVHLAAGYLLSEESVNALIGIGGYIEIPQYNTALKVAGGWLKLGIKF